MEKKQLNEITQEGKDTLESVVIGIRNAESKAEDIIRTAEEQATSRRAQADARALEILEESKKNSKAEKMSIIYSAGLKADMAFESVVSECKGECDKMRSSLEGDVEKLSDEIFGRLIKWQ